MNTGVLHSEDLTALELMPGGVILIGSDGRIAYANQFAIDTYGARCKDDLVGRTPLDFPWPGDPEGRRAAMEAISCGLRLPVGTVLPDQEWTLRRTDGTAAESLWETRVVEYEEQPALLSFLHLRLAERVSSLALSVDRNTHATDAALGGLVEASVRSYETQKLLEEYGETRDDQDALVAALVARVELLTSALHSVRNVVSILPDCLESLSRWVASQDNSPAADTLRTWLDAVSMTAEHAAEAMRNVGPY